MMALPSLITIPISDRISGRAASFQPDQFRPIARLTADPTVLAVRAESKWNTLADFIRDVKAQPGKISYSSSGIYGTTHVAMEILANAAGLQMIHVPFGGGGQQIQSLLAGQVDATMQTPGAIAAHIASGKLRLLAAMSRDRVPSLPDLPTARELGYDGEFYLWTGVFGLHPPDLHPGHGCPAHAHPVPGQRGVRPLPAGRYPPAGRGPDQDGQDRVSRPSRPPLTAE
jgi:tripartite-type tricarboxylate transporter receptor subunit TctC